MEKYVYFFMKYNFKQFHLINIFKILTTKYNITNTILEIWS